jgi:type II secretory pathway pseudopilin PulG
MSARAARRSGSGYTLIETLVSMALMTIAGGVVLTLLTPSHGVFQARSEQIDMIQRLRITADTIGRDLAAAGAGPYQSRNFAALGTIAATVLPRRAGAMLPDPMGTAATDRVSILYVPSAPAQTAIRVPAVAGASTLAVDPRPGCPAGRALCGFDAGDLVIVFDESGGYDVLKVSGTDDGALQIVCGSPLSRGYDKGAVVAEVVRATYWFDAANARVMKYDGDRSDLPLADNIVSMRFDYFGEAAAPELTKPVTDPDGPWTTYGPKPPALGQDDERDAWGAGENCVFQVDTVTGVQLPRLASLGAAGSPPVPIPPAMLSDGPWCPDDFAANGYDADLLRVRKIRVTLRVQAAAATLRGPAGALFARAGTATRAERLVPDQQIGLEITPRNLALAR